MLREKKRLWCHLPIACSSLNELVIASHNVAWQSSRGRYAGCPGNTESALSVRWIAA